MEHKKKTTANLEVCLQTNGGECVCVCKFSTNHHGDDGVITPTCLSKQSNQLGMLVTGVDQLAKTKAKKKEVVRTKVNQR